MLHFRAHKSRSIGERFMPGMAKLDVKCRGCKTHWTSSTCRGPRPACAQYAIARSTLANSSGRQTCKSFDCRREPAPHSLFQPKAGEALVCPVDSTLPVPCCFRHRQSPPPHWAPYGRCFNHSTLASTADSLRQRILPRNAALQQDARSNDCFSPLVLEPITSLSVPSFSGRRRP